MSFEADSRPPLADRAAVRHKIFERGVVILLGVERTAHILNLSDTGALIHSDVDVRRSLPVSVRIAGRDIQAEVMWVDGPRFGVRFDRKLPPDVFGKWMR